MKFKKIISLVLIIILLSMGLTFAQDNQTPEYFTIFYNNRQIDFANNPLEINNVLMVPMRQFFESVGAYVQWINESRQVIAYRDNMFIKLKIDDNKAYMNGKEITLQEAPIIRENRTYVPMEFIAKTFDMHINREDNVVFINNKYRENVYNLLGHVFYKKHYLKDDSIEFSLPNSWEKLSDTSFKYSLYEGIKEYKLSISSQELDKSTLKEYVIDMKNQLNKNFPEVLEISSINETTINNINFEYITLNRKLNNETNDNIMYFFEKDKKVFIFNFNYIGNITIEEARDFTENILNTIKISSLEINKNNEHYIEYQKFFNYGINLTNEIFSNIQVENFINFEGTLENEYIDMMKATVKKDNDQKTFNIPVENKEFSSKIYTPFGLGRHNIIVTTKNYNSIQVQEHDIKTIIGMNEENSEVLMEFSVVNFSDDDILYKIPSEYVNANDVSLKFFALDQTYPGNTNYKKAEILYEWIFENINLVDDEQDNVIDNELKNSIEVFETQNGTNLELNILYTALLRSINIPTRIVKRETIDDEIIYNTEIYLNGKWIITDLNTEKENYVNNNFSYTEYFDIYDRNYFDNLKPKFEILNY